MGKDGTMATQEEMNICTAPRGMYQIVQVDPRDHWPTRHGEPLGTTAEVRTALRKMLWPQREVMQVFNDSGKQIAV